jgi:hypothetical protein
MILRTLFQQPGLHFNLRWWTLCYISKGNTPPILSSFDDNRFVHGWIKSLKLQCPHHQLTWAAVKKVIGRGWMEVEEDVWLHSWRAIHCLRLRPLKKVKRSDRRPKTKHQVLIQLFWKFKRLFWNGLSWGLPYAEKFCIMLNQPVSDFVWLKWFG